MVAPPSHLSSDTSIFIVSFPMPIISASVPMQHTMKVAVSARAREVLEISDFVGPHEDR